MTFELQVAYFNVNNHILVTVMGKKSYIMSIVKYLCIILNVLRLINAELI